MPEVVVLSYAVGSKYSPGQLILVSLITVQSYDMRKYSGTYGCILYNALPHYHHYADGSEDTELLKDLSGTFCRVWV